MNKNYPLAPIVHGTVIDHIAVGQALKIVRLLGWTTHRQPLYIGLTLLSRSCGVKDLIKIEGRALTDAEASQVAIFSPGATVNIIEEGVVAIKYKVSFPETVRGLLRCPNPQCITCHEPMKTLFSARQQSGNGVMLRCRYCERLFAREEFVESHG